MEYGQKQKGNEAHCRKASRDHRQPSDLFRYIQQKHHKADEEQYCGHDGHLQADSEILIRYDFIDNMSDFYFHAKHLRSESINQKTVCIIFIFNKSTVFFLLLLLKYIIKG